MPVDSEALLEESGWVRALARRLAADHQRAEDLAQETLVAALQRPRKEGVPLRRWLAAVMRNLWQQERRGELRRADREARASLGEAEGAEPTPDLVARLEAHRAVVDAVLALHEPYRSVLVARYFDGLAPRAIAQRRGLPVRTVHTQLARALALLRARLERAHGGAHGAWLPILGLLMGVDRPGGLVGTALGALAMDVKLKAAMGVAALAGLFFVARPLWNGARPAGAVPAAPAPAPLVAAVETPSTPFVSPRAEVGREAPVRDVQAAPQADVAASGGLALRALDLQGRAVAGLAVRCAGEPDVHLTDADGRITLPCADPERAPEVADERWMLLREPVEWSRSASAPSEIVVAPRLRLAGRVVDELGRPLERAQVRVFLPLLAAGGVPEPLQSMRTRTWTTESDALGEFRLEAAALPGGMLVARLPDHRTELRPQPATSALDLLLELSTLEAGEDLLGGLVVDESGLPVADARVALGLEHTRSDARGRFLIRLPGHDEIGVLTALAPGRLPARLERAAPTDRDPLAWPDPLILTLGGRPLSIAGRVLDENGVGVEGVRVRVLDPTHFGAVEWGDSEGFTVQGFAESLLAGQAGRPEVQSDARGAFALEGLLPRDYTLVAEHPPSLRQVESGPVAAGVAGLVLRLPAPALRPLVAGRVQGLNGDALAGVRVTLLAEGPRFAPVGGHGGPEFRDALYGPSALTDAEGRFRFADVPLAVSGLQVDGPGLQVGQKFGLATGEDPEDLRLRVVRGCSLEIDLGESGVVADRAVPLDGDGAGLGVTVHLGELLYTSDGASLHEGRSGPFTVSETVRTVVLYAQGAEVLRLPVTPTPGASTVVRP